jgi:hypothetical protein
MLPPGGGQGPPAGLWHYGGTTNFKARHAGDCSLSIDTLFDASPIQNGRPRTHLQDGGDKEKPLGFSSSRKQENSHDQ